MVEKDPDSARPAKPKRADARRNRERIMTAAVKVLAEMGVDAQMTDIARAAGVGVATLYRNFPSKEDLVHALALERVARMAEEADTAAQSSDPFDALVTLLRWITDRQLEDRVLSQFLGGLISRTSELHEQRDLVYGAIGRIVEQAQRAGKLRDDINASDIRMVMVAVSRMSTTDSPASRWLVHRHLGILIDGMRAPGLTELEEPSVSIDDADAAVYPDATEPTLQELALRRGRPTWRR